MQRRAGMAMPMLRMSGQRDSDDFAASAPIPRLAPTTSATRPERSTGRRGWGEPCALLLIRFPLAYARVRVGSSAPCPRSRRRWR
jgi:hypothetical protein